MRHADAVATAWRDHRKGSERSPRQSSVRGEVLARRRAAGKGSRPGQGALSMLAPRDPLRGARWPITTACARASHKPWAVRLPVRARPVVPSGGAGFYPGAAGCPPIGDYANNSNFFRSSPIRLSTALSMASFDVAKFCAHLLSGMLTMLRRTRSAASKSLRACTRSRNTRALRVPGPSLSSDIHKR